MCAYDFGNNFEREGARRVSSVGGRLGIVLLRRVRRWDRCAHKQGQGHLDVLFHVRQRGRVAVKAMEEQQKGNGS